MTQADEEAKYGGALGYWIHMQSLAQAASQGNVAASQQIAGEALSGSQYAQEALKGVGLEAVQQPQPSLTGTGIVISPVSGTEPPRGFLQTTSGAFVPAEIVSGTVESGVGTVTETKTDWGRFLETEEGKLIRGYIGHGQIEDIEPSPGSPLSSNITLALKTAGVEPKDIWSKMAIASVGDVIAAASVAEQFGGQGVTSGIGEIYTKLSPTGSMEYLIKSQEAVLQEQKQWEFQQALPTLIESPVNILGSMISLQDPFGIMSIGTYVWGKAKGVSDIEIAKTIQGFKESYITQRMGLDPLRSFMLGAGEGLVLGTTLALPEIIPASALRAGTVGLGIVQVGTSAPEAVRGDLASQVGLGMGVLMIGSPLISKAIGGITSKMTRMKPLETEALSKVFIGEAGKGMKISMLETDVEMGIFSKKIVKVPSVGLTTFVDIGKGKILSIADIATKTGDVFKESIAVGISKPWEGSLQFQLPEGMGRGGISYTPELMQQMGLRPSVQIMKVVSERGGLFGKIGRAIEPSAPDEFLFKPYEQTYFETAREMLPGKVRLLREWEFPKTSTLRGEMVSELKLEGRITQIRIRAGQPMAEAEGWLRLGKFAIQHPYSFMEISKKIVPEWGWKTYIEEGTYPKILKHESLHAIHLGQRMMGEKPTEILGERLGESKIQSIAKQVKELGYPQRKVWEESLTRIQTKELPDVIKSSFLAKEGIITKPNLLTKVSNVLGYKEETSYGKFLTSEFTGKSKLSLTSDWERTYGEMSTKKGPIVKYAELEKITQKGVGGGYGLRSRQLTQTIVNFEQPIGPTVKLAEISAMKQLPSGISPTISLFPKVSFVAPNIKQTPYIQGTSFVQEETRIRPFVSGGITTQLGTLKMQIKQPTVRLRPKVETILGESAILRQRGGGLQPEVSLTRQASITSQKLSEGQLQLRESISIQAFGEKQQLLQRQASLTKQAAISPTSPILVPPAILFPPMFGFGGGILTSGRRGKKLYARKYKYTPTVFGMMSGLKIRKAPKDVGIQSVGIRFPVGEIRKHGLMHGLKKMFGPGPKVNTRAKKKYHRNFFSGLGI